MPKFFVDREQIRGGKVIINGDNFHHISKVLRAGIGDDIVVSDSQGFDYVCEINGIYSEHLTARIEDFTKNPCEPNVKITIFQSIPKFDKMESLIQKCVELGVHKIVPVSSERCIAKLDEYSEPKKILRWRRISESAAKQCGRGLIPEVVNVVTFSEALELSKEFDTNIFAYEKENDTAIKDLHLQTKDSIGVFIGPEGGYSDEEYELAKKAGLSSVTLGKRILRTETAGMYIVSILMYILES